MKAEASKPTRHPLPQKLLSALRAYLLCVGTAVTLFAAWLLSPLPIPLTRALEQNDPPALAAAIVCLGSGAGDGFPSSAGWRRVRTCARLYEAGYAPMIVFSGAAIPGTRERSAAAIYADAAQLLGVPAAACVLEERARRTAEHPRRLLELAPILQSGGTAAPLLIVTSPYHGLRAALSFRKAGFRDVRIVTRFPPPDDVVLREERAAARGFTYRLVETLLVTREWLALAYYRYSGWI